MICPYCAKEMEVGFLEQPRGILTWTPEGKHVPLLFPLTAGSSIAIAEPGRGPLAGSMVTAHLCRGCEKILIDIEGVLE